MTRCKLNRACGHAPGFCGYQQGQIPKLLFNVLKAGHSLDFSFWSLFKTMIEQAERHLLGKLRKKLEEKFVKCVTEVACLRNKNIISLQSCRLFFSRARVDLVKKK